MDNVGGSIVLGNHRRTAKLDPGVPDEYGLKASAFVDAGSVFGYSGSTASLQVANKNVVPLRSAPA